MNILILSGSNIGSKTRVVAQYAYDSLTSRYGADHSLQFIDLKEKDLVFSDGRNYLDYQGDTAEVTQAIMSADVIIFASPIFQAAIPATLKNVFDLLPQNALQYKTCSIIMTAGSDKHYLIAEQQLKPILSYMKANVLPNYVFAVATDFDHGRIVNDDVHFRIEKLVEDTIVLARSYQQIWQDQEEQYGF
ncbi:FMN reductase [Amphibacillus marinus]|uniref:FMN reductase n=1 Tax=Amphibacillus marinus TaxID=872970 RepID=A0A1H8L3Y0_9BACI|nr:NADPH-dependent FMN reductase [Amphibacillus marinus]SEN99882.1 FMN reductase [Amphibacillus marinus]